MITSVSFNTPKILMIGMNYIFPQIESIKKRETIPLINRQHKK